MRNLLLSLPVIFFSSFILFCDDETVPVPIPTPCEFEECEETEIEPVEDICATLDTSGMDYFCEAGTLLWNYCLFEGTCFTYEQVAQLVVWCNVLWDDLMNQFVSDTFNDAVLKEDFDELIEDFYQPFKPTLIGFFRDIDLCDVESAFTLMQLKYSLLYYIKELAFQTTGGSWDFLYDFIPMLGLSYEDAYVIFHEHVQNLNDVLYLVSGEGVTETFMEALTVEPECGFNPDDMNSDAPENLVNLITYWTNDAEETCEEWESLVNSIVDNELRFILYEVVDLFADIHTYTESRSTIYSLGTVLPSLLSDLITEDASFCEE